MHMIRQINNLNDLVILFGELKTKPMGYSIVVEETKPQKGTERYQQWLGLSKFFHNGIVRVFSDVTGISKDEAKEYLQVRFALIDESPTAFYVESTSDMSFERFSEFADECCSFLYTEFGQYIDPKEYEMKPNKKTKEIKKWQQNK